MRVRFPRVRAALMVLTAGLLSVMAFAAPAAATTGTCVSSGKCYLVQVSPASVPAGDSGSFAFTVTNEAATQSLGSIQITAPASFVITGASTTTGTASYSPGSSSTPGSALFLNLSLSPNQSVELTVDATVPCGSGTDTTYQWTTGAKQSNQFNGSGNDFTLDPSSTLSTTVSGACSLTFTGEPNATVVGAPITTGVASTGGPVQVEVLDGSGSLMASSTAPVSVALGANPASGSLSGTATADASGGIASFSGLTIGKAGQGYTLVASSPGMTSGTSAYFSMYDVLPACRGNCSGSASTRTTSATVTTSGTSGQYLALGIGGVSFGCGPAYQETSDPASFNLLSGSTGTPDSSAAFAGTLEISKAAVQSSGHPGAASWQICYASTSEFTGETGTVTIGGVTYHTGLLPDCSSTQGAPCVEARNKDNAGNVLITFLATGDPNMWG